MYDYIWEKRRLNSSFELVLQASFSFFLLIFFFHFSAKVIKTKKLKPLVSLIFFAFFSSYKHIVLFMLIYYEFLVIAIWEHFFSSINTFKKNLRVKTSFSQNEKKYTLLCTSPKNNSYIPCFFVHHFHNFFIHSNWRCTIVADHRRLVANQQLSGRSPAT